MGFIVGPSYTTEQGIVISSLYLSVNFYRFIPLLNGTMQCVIGLSAYLSRDDKYAGSEPFVIPVSLSTIDTNMSQLEFYRKSLYGIAYAIVKTRWEANGFIVQNVFEANQPSPTQYVYDCSGFNIDGFGISGYNAAGYNMDGFNSAGYNAAGYDQSGYNSEGYDISGFDREGYTAEGYDRMGYNRDGYNRGGYDRQGFTSTGYDVDGFNREGINKDGIMSSRMTTMIQMSTSLWSTFLTVSQFSTTQALILADPTYSYRMVSISTFMGIHTGDMISSFTDASGAPFLSTVMDLDTSILSTFRDASGNYFISTIR